MGDRPKLPLFPLIRHFSGRLTPWLVRTPVSANQVTTLSLAAGLTSAGLFADGTHTADIYGGLALLACYVLDNVDGEIARHRGQASNFGMHFDTFVDWLVHAAVFAALGIGAAARTGAPAWMWMGAIAAAGCTVNYLLHLVFLHRDRAANGDPEPADQAPARPANAWQWTVFAFRELARADFCFLVVGLALLDAVWVLVPAGMIGAQVYWMMQFVAAARRFKA